MARTQINISSDYGTCLIFKQSLIIIEPGDNDLLEWKYTVHPSPYTQQVQVNWIICIKLLLYKLFRFHMFCYSVALRFTSRL